MIEDEIVSIVINGLVWGVSLTMIIGVMAWGVRAVIGIFQQAANV